MLDVSPSNLRQEVEAAVRLCKDHTDVSARLIRQYAGGRNYRNSWDPEVKGGVVFENHAFEWCASFIPNLVDQNPAIDIEIDGVDSSDPSIAAMRDGMNSWIKAIDLASTLHEIALDLQFDFGVALVTLEVVPGYEAGADLYKDERAGLPPPLRPKLHRISPRRFFIDPQASTKRHARFIGHTWIEDKDDLLAAKNQDGTPKFNREVIESLGSDADVDAIRKTEMKRVGDRIDRNQVVGHEVYVPETGMIYTIGYVDGAQTSKYLREPRKYEGPQTGPYVLFGLHIVPDQVYPLPPLAVTADDVLEINAHAKQISEDAGTAKRLIVTDGSKDVTDAITMALNGSVVGIPGFTDGRAKQFEFGGAQPANVEYLQFLRDRLDRKSGLTETARGNITNATAEEVATAQQNRNVRVRFARNMFRQGVIELLRIVAWHLWHSAEVEFETGTGTFVGGAAPGQERTNFESLRITIEPYSMEAVDEAVLQKRINDAAGMLLSNAQLMVAAPFINWQNVINDAYEALNIKGGGARYVDFQVLGAMQRMANPALFMAIESGQDPLALMMGAQQGPQAGAAPSIAGRIGPGSGDGPQTQGQAKVAQRRSDMA